MVSSKNRWNRRIFVALIIALLLSKCALAAIAPQDMVFTDYGMDYHLTDFLNGYNVIAFGNAHMNLHAMGSILVEGEYSGSSSNSGFSDGSNLPPSFIKGVFSASNSIYNSRNQSTNQPLYLGSVNTVETQTSNGRTTYTIQLPGNRSISTGNGGTTPVYINDNFFNFDEAYKVVKIDQQTILSRGTKLSVPSGYWVTLNVNVGDNVIIESLSGIGVINIVGDINKLVNTTISVLDGGDISMPMMHINGSQPQVVEQGANGTSIVWNIPNAKSVKLPTMNWLGHVIAPDATVTMDSGNYNGCIVCKNFSTSAEGHVYNYQAMETSWDVVFSLEKEWVDGDDADGIRPDSIKVDLMANGKKAETVTLSAKDGWYYIWNDLAQKDANGNDIVYTVVEHAVEGYTSQYNAQTQTLINTHEPVVISLHGTKTWANELNFGSKMRPMYFTVHLYADGEEIASKTLQTTSGTTQDYSFENLPKYKNGKEIKYVVHEDTVPGYIATASEDHLSLTNTWGGEAVEVSGTKTWVDDNDRDGLRPQNITVQLLANGKAIEEHIISAQDAWKFTFTNLPSQDGSGKQIVYSVKEKSVPEGYKASYSGYDITNTHEIEIIRKLSGQKTWNDDNNNDGLRPQSITIVLLADGVRHGVRTVTAQDNWKWEFTDLPKYNGGREIRYTVVEENEIPGYTSRTDGLNLINTHVKETVSVSGSKTWMDDNNRDGLRPQSITVNLFANGKKVDEKKITAADNWAWNFTGLDKYKDGAEIAYTITEDRVAGYTAEVNGFDIINTHEPETISLSGKKIWKDNNNQDGIRPHSVVVRLYKQLSNADTPVEVDTFTVQPDSNGDWTGEFGRLPKYENGKEIIYTIREDAVPGYTVSYKGLDIINTHEPETIKISGSKTWIDNNDQYGKRPDKIRITLFADGAKVAEKNVNESSGWTWAFDDLPKFNAGKRIVYTIEEDIHDGYTVDIHRINRSDDYLYKVINTYEPETVHISGEKRWIDGNNQDGKRPGSITIRLLADGVEVASKVVTAQDNWTWTFTGLPRYAGGNEISYTITEDKVADYETQISGYNAINVHQPETVEVRGAKTWNDNNNQDGKRPDSITIRLHKKIGNGAATEVDHKIITDDEGWTWAFTDLPKYENGLEITYSITEDAVAGYTSLVNGYNVTNTRETETITVSGSKTWNDDNNRDGKRPESITIRLLANGSEVSSKAANAAGGWKWSFTNLPRYANGSEIVYSISEDPVANYTSEISGFNATNTHRIETICVSGRKTWDDNNNQDGKRPDYIIVSLYADGRYTAQYRHVSSYTNWAWSFDNLPKYKNVNGMVSEIAYTIVEDPVPGYTAVYNSYDITNSRSSETVNVSGKKIWNDGDNQDGKRPTSITINLLANGTVIQSQQISADSTGGWSWNFNNLPRYSAGREIIYSISEEKVEGYVTSYVPGSYDVVNTRNVSKTSVPVTKIWMDDNNAAGKRPESITVHLLANGKLVNSQVITAQDNWAWTFTDLPTFSKGKPITYTISEDMVAGYAASINGYRITNTYGLTDFTVTKIWEGQEKSEDIQLTIYGNGVALNPQPRYQRSGNVYTWKDLPKRNASGQEILYSAVEMPMPGYEAQYINPNGATDAAYDGGTIVNSARTSVSVRKVWLGNDTALPEIQLTLYCNDQPMNVAQPQPNQDGWYVYTNLPAMLNGQKAVYSVKETPVPGFTTSYVNENGATNAAYDGGTIYNQPIVRIPDTGDHFPMIPCIISLLAGLAGFAVLKKRGRRNNSETL